ncbi:Holliday junction resolvase RuvX [Hydrogenimonas cancrithermarum]|uniref:Putative pre-16S rRNA nuclease n=1 Tax=Hydrogenimonas cancrithermarum TaxID=2993563 RepID=A0ABM8FJ14_9BACT|nr:Holliday junction resolvase RuvX [Hydrogenimonas cancrithermarum]BDY12263.1 putative pre-16S rRNA nuclease [Hydrogenimonas cancrithermarum]
MERERVAAIDVGLKRIGTAIALDGKTVLPQTPILRKNRDQAARDVDAFLESWKIDRLVVGLPKGGGSEEEMERRIHHFVSLLNFTGAIEFVDEAYSSAEAAEMMKGVMRQRHDGRLDSIAAQLILERYLSRSAPQ